MSTVRTTPPVVLVSPRPVSPVHHDTWWVAGWSDGRREAWCRASPASAESDVSYRRKMRSKSTPQSTGTFVSARMLSHEPFPSVGFGNTRDIAQQADSVQREVCIALGGCLRRSMRINTLWTSTIGSMCSRMFLTKTLELPLPSAATALLAPSRLGTRVAMPAEPVRVRVRMGCVVGHVLSFALVGVYHQYC